LLLQNFVDATEIVFQKILRGFSCKENKEYEKYVVRKNLQKLVGIFTR